MRRPASLAARLALLFSLAAAVVFSTAAWFIEQSVERHFEEQDLDLMQGKLDLTRHALGRLQSPADLDKLAERMADALVGHHGLELSIQRGSGEQVFSTMHHGKMPVFPIDAGKTLLHGWQMDGMQMRGFSALASTAIPGEPPMRVTLSVDVMHHEQFLRAFHRSLFWVIGLSVLAVAVLSRLIARRSLQPIQDVARMASQISASHLNERLKLERVPRELHDLAEQFNAMLERLQEAFVRLSDFSSDLAHELRTPISNLTTQTQVSLSRVRSPDEYREVLFSNLEEYERLSRMVSDMLYLAKADNGLLVPQWEAVALDAEVDALIEFFEPVASERGLSLQRSGSATVRADHLMLRRALANLLSNAVRHAHGNSTVAIRIEVADGLASVAVSNQGATIPEVHLPRLFDRFYRVDPARTRSSDGAGLGLAITRSIVAAHGGEISVVSSEGTTTFCIRVPVGGLAAELPRG
ncbi:heavy metal sensor histidine kinase [Niveibacterium sp.]|uniref:heavy metal sensor histidine kinase n=1 Tax=Niveibacterium sp. TaxID=2017444 RepID=UPI0035B4468B